MPRTSKKLDTRAFFRMLRRRGPRKDRFDRALDERCGREMAILMSDASGFTRKTHEYGILQFLAVMARGYERLAPIIRRRGGEVLWQRADNLLAIFPDPQAAVRAAIQLHLRLRRMNRGKPERERFNICIGIDFGRAIHLEDNVFGACVNVASKLGEDLAEKDEILVTGEVARRVRGRFRCVYARSAELGGRTFELFRIRY